MEKARLECIMEGTLPTPEVCQPLFLLQNADGGFPFGLQPGNLSAINETTVALWWMEELNLLDSPPAGWAMDYLLATQHADGSWDEDPHLVKYELPPWIRLGDLRTQMYLTVYAAYWLALGDRSLLPGFRKALHYLLRHRDETGKFYGYLHTTWIATAVFWMAGKRYSSVAREGMQVLTDTNLSDWEDSQIAWALDCLSRAGLAADDVFAKRALEQLDRRQKVDGSWASEDGEASAVGATLQAIKVLKRYGMVNVRM